MMLLAVTGLLSAGSAIGQTKPESPSDLIRFLTFQSGRAYPMWANANGCGDAPEDRAAASSLVALGASAIPDIESAFDLIERSGQQAKGAINSGWLVFAYARIKGPRAFPRFKAMIKNPRLGFLKRDLDDAVAISLGLTSYVSRVGHQVPFVHCGVVEPRDALDELVVAWERDDRPRLEAHLGPNARVSLASLQAGRPWTSLRARLWRGRSASDSAMGYHLEISGELSQPRETLDQAITDQRRFAHLERYAPTLDLQTRFVNRPGRGCGQRGVRFVLTEGRMKGMLTKYVVDDSNMEGLLRMIAACATQ